MDWVMHLLAQIHTEASVWLYLKMEPGAFKEVIQVKCGHEGGVLTWED